ncbi:hypothetical protein [uncultured Jannaschia sp.]|uniref:hypothetical protein n=1 Tax=uncultured Jannaschia sp. TaxID=293347 RepID=UPI002630097D|nr:hypothetical protein [uncultured Jannaschia sp.]
MGPLNPFGPDLEGDGDDNFSDGLRLTRRGFLGSVGATAVATAAKADTQDDAHEVALLFAWNADNSAGGARVLDVSIVTSGPAPPDDRNETDDGGGDPVVPEDDVSEEAPDSEFAEIADALAEGDLRTRFWRIRPESFGTDAKFALKVSGNPGALRYDLRIADASYGRLRTTPTRPRGITFSFQQVRKDDRLRFVLTAFTTIWSSSNGPNKINGFGLAGIAEQGGPEDLLFRDFIEGRAGRDRRLGIQLPLSRVTNTFVLMFNGLIGRADGVGERLVDLRFDAAATWHVVARGRAMSALAGQVDLAGIRVFWPVVRDAATARAAGAPLYAVADVLEDGSGSNVREISIGRSRRGPALRGRCRIENGRLFLRTARPQDGDGNVIQDGTMRAEAVLSGMWRDVGFVGASPAASAVGMPEMVGSLLERVSAKAAPSDANPAQAEGSISFQARYSAKRKDFSRLNTALGAISAMGIRAEPERPETEEGGDAGADEPSASFPKRRGFPVTALFEWGRGGATRRDPATSLIDAEVGMVEAGVRLPGAEFSRLTFEPSALRIYYAPTPLASRPLGSFLSLSLGRGREVARLDLARARLRASRTTTLLALGFRFSDLALSFRDEHVEFVRYNTACELTTRPGPDGRLEPHDTRPVMVVEFPPQHLFEEARSVQTAPPLPDVRLDAKLTLTPAEVEGKWKVDCERVAEGQPRPLYRETCDEIVLYSDNRAHLADALAALRRKPGIEAEKSVRMEIQALKSDDTGPSQDADTDERRARFRELVEELKAHRWVGSPPEAQKLYVGPVAMDVDVFQGVRKAWIALWRRVAEGFASGLLEDAFDRIEADAGGDGTGATIAGALAREGRIESAVPSYQRFRDAYREAMLTHVLTSGSSPQPVVDLGTKAPRTTDPVDIEYFADAKDGGPAFVTDAATRSALRARREAMLLVFVSQLQDVDKNIGGPSRGRLSGGSRLAFRVRCRDGLDAARADRRLDLDQPEDAASRLPREELAFDLDALTQFRGMELAVMARSEIVHDPGELGQISARRPRVADTSVDAMLERLDFELGEEVSVRTRLSDVAGSLKPPGGLETSIELPARLMLSPNQTATVLTPQKLPAAFPFDHPSGVLPEGIRARRTQPLWQAEFVTEADGLGLDPGLRAVWSPDLRPGALLSRFADGAAGGATTIAHTEPPGGPFAPWALSRLQGQATGMSEADLRSLTHLRDAGGNLLPKQSDGDVLPEEVCAADLGPRPGILRRFCERLARRKAEDTDPDPQFRAPMDARDRHQIVLLSSAWGLPVIGRRNAGGVLTSDSSQFEASSRSALWDVMPGSAIYRPRPLEVTELSLSALGGTIRHDTGFQPPSAAQFWRDGEATYGSLSLERWQQWTNIGRDIFTEVVHKGFLFPLGIRASLVKVTERVFFMDKATGAITAPLRQRIFIRVANPVKLFPAIKQPFGGRRFPVRTLNLLTTVTPDIVDPNEEAAAEGEVASTGRIGLEGGAGLVFWPRLFRALPGNLRFEMDIDGVKCDLPLIFAENTAIGNETTLAALVDYYNDPRHVADPDTDAAADRPINPIRHIRTLVFGGAERRYAEEVKAGSASFQTDHWTLAASGKGGRPMAKEDGPEGKVETVPVDSRDFELESILEGADQPPFYPLVTTARIHLTQVERLVAKDIPPVRAQFDARYVIHGLSPEDDALQPSLVQSLRPNPNELVLVVVDPPKLDMGEKGDQSGGVFRPSGKVIALSRKKGAMTTGGTLGLKRQPPQTLISVVKAFGEFPAVSQEQDGITGGTQTSSGATGTGVQSYEPNYVEGPTGADGGAARDGITEIIDELRTIYQEFFSDDARLLGLVPIRDLIAFVQRLNSPDEGLPDLSERLEFGAGLIDDAMDAVTVVRLQVVRPLAAAVRRIRTSWDQIEANLANLQAGVPAAPITIREIFPELDIALTNLDAALARAEGETDTILFALELGGCYASGQQFLGALQRAAANPTERVEDAISSRYAEALGLFTDLRDGIEDRIRTVITDAFRNIPGNADEVLTEQVESFISGISGGVLGREIIALPRSEATYDPANLADFQGCIAGILPVRADIDAVLQAFAGWIVGKIDFRTVTSGPRFDPRTIVGEFLGSGPDIQFSEDQKIAELLMGSAVEARGRIEDLFTSIEQEMIEKAALSNPIKAQLKAEAGRIADSLTAGAGSVFEEVNGALEERAGNKAEQIRNRYMICTLINLAGDPNCQAKIAAVDASWIVSFFVWLRRLTPTLTPGDLPTLPDVLVPDLSGLLDPVIRLVERLSGVLSAIVAADARALLSTMRDLLEEIGVPLPNADCTALDPILKTIDAVLAGLATTADAVNPHPPEWTGPACPLEGSQHGIELDDIAEMNQGEPSPTASAFTIRVFADRARELHAADITDRAEALVTALEDFRVEAAGAGLTGPAETAGEMQERIRASIVRTEECLDRLSHESGAAYCEFMLTGEAVRTFQQTLKAAQGLDLCDPMGLARLRALQHLPGHVKALETRREALVAAMTTLAATSAEKLQAIHAAALSDDATEAIELLPFVLAGEALVSAKFDPAPDLDEAAFPFIEPLRDAQKALADAMDEAADPVGILVSELLKTLCAIFDRVGQFLAEVEMLVEAAETQLRALETQFGTGSNPSALGTEVLRLVARVRQRLDTDGFLARMRALSAELETLRPARDAVCSALTTLADLDPAVLPALVDLFADRQARSGAASSEGSLAIRTNAIARDVTEALSPLPDTLLTVIQEGSRRAMNQALLAAANRALNVTIAGETIPSVYRTLAEKRDGFTQAFAEQLPVGGEGVAAPFTVAPDFARLAIGEYDPKEGDQLAGDVAWLKAIAEEVPTGDAVDPAARFLSEFLREWSIGAPTPLVILDQLANLLQDILSGDVFKNIDFAAIRDEVEDYLLSLVPTKLRMGYDFEIELGSEVAAATAGIFAPKKGTRLGIDMQIVLDLRESIDRGRPEVAFRSVGTLGPFDVALIGDFFDALTLSFAGARFVSEGGAKSDISVAYKDHKIGKKLEFVQKLEKYLAPKDGSGVILRFNPDQPGIEAGFRLQLGDFSVGNLAFTNVGLESTAILPFSDQAALFRASLSSRANPFTLTYAPYGGSGFFSILANTDGIIGFEAGFEFGGSAVFAYGPLNGIGRLMSGVYIRQLQLNGMKLTEISMTFFAGGSASIWVFSFSAALSVKLGMVDGDMVGEATFSFSFSMGLADFEYSIEIFKEEGEGFQGQSALHVPRRRRFAALGDPGPSAGGGRNPFGAEVTTDGTCQSRNWAKFKSYFDDVQPPEGYF